MNNNQVAAGLSIGGLVLGGLIGVVVGLLVAPRSGAETRSMLSDKVDELYGEGKSVAAQSFEKIQETASTAGAKIQETAAAAGDKLGAAAGNLKPRINESRDELRAK
ncbi:MAG: YtxH domain-containing protein, partial [Coriobacteriales bacterium]|nr:YtxH domain-containing protein [Coriobacteriales bacterium]